MERTSVRLAVDLAHGAAPLLAKRGSPRSHESSGVAQKRGGGGPGKGSNGFSTLNTPADPGSPTGQRLYQAARASNVTSLTGGAGRWSSSPERRLWRTNVLALPVHAGAPRTKKRNPKSKLGEYT